MTDYAATATALRVCADKDKGCDDCPYMAKCLTNKSGKHVAMTDAADAIEELQRINSAMKPKYDIVCVKCAYYAEAKHNKKGFLICPASGMDITAWDFCSYFEPQPPKEETE